MESDTNTMTQKERFRTRDDILELDIQTDREEKLRTAFSNTEYGERIRNCVAATFKPDSTLEKSGVILASRLHRDRIFEMISSFADAKEEVSNGTIASAKVKDQDTGDELSAHITDGKVLVSVRSENADFASFRDYVLFLEQSLNVELTVV